MKKLLDAFIDWWPVLLFSLYGWGLIIHRVAVLIWPLDQALAAAATFACFTVWFSIFGHLLRVIGRKLDQVAA
jgi:hypothetical protein